MLVRDVMSSNVLVVSPDDSVSAFIGLMEKYHIHEAPVVKDGKLLGLVHYKNITGKGMTDPTSTKISTLTSGCPQVSPDDPLDRAAEMIFRNSMRALPVVERGQLVGIISVFDLADSISRSKEFRQTTAEAVMSVSETIKDDEDIGKARVMMREKNVSRLPVVDKEGKLYGIVTIFDLLRAVKPRERISWYSMAAEKLATMNIPVSVVTNRNPVTADKKTSLTELASIMKRYQTSGVTIVEDGGPVGVVTARDILEFYFASKERKGVYVQITGLSGEDYDVVHATVDRMIRDTLQKIALITNPQYLYLRVKKYEKAGAKIKYSIRCRLMTDKGMFITKGWDWDLRDAVAQGLDNLEKVFVKKKEIARDRVMRRMKRSSILKRGG